MQDESERGFAFGQTEKLTTRIRGLIHDYPEGLGIIKELLQNADDAGARVVRIVVDWNTYESSRLPGVSAAKLQGPSLLVFNDREFTPTDLHDIQQIGNSGKAKTAEKTGRFGLGFNSVYNVTDWPGFVTANSVQFFDPHRSAIPGATAEHPGRGWQLSECWARFPDLITPFIAGGLPFGAEHFAGTIFRLPFRTSEHASRSEISPNKTFGRDNITAIVEELRAIAGEILLFLKHVEVLTVSELNTNGTLNQLISLTTTNPEEVRTSRDSVFPLLKGDTATLIQKLRSDPSLRPSTTYTHRILARYGDATHESSWMVVSGLFLDPTGQVLITAEEMIDRGEKAIPLAGAAVLLQANRSLTKTPFRGRAYCSLPLNVETGLPVHVNGFFDLDSARHTLTLPGAQTGKDKVRGRWNEIVATNVIPQAYARLISELSRHFGDRRPHAFYAYWPDQSLAQGRLIESLVQSVYRYLAPMPVIRSASSPVWAPVTELSLIPRDKLGRAIEAPLVAERQKIPFPALPQKIIRGFKAASIKVQTLQPADLRNLLRVSHAIGKPPKEAPRISLTKKRWIKSLLLFCLSDGKRDLKGLPLLLMADGTVQAFGYGPGGKTFLASWQQRNIFSKYPHWFVDESFFRSCGIDPYPEVGLVAMTATDFVDRLKSAFSGADHTWQPSGAEPPNTTWLIAVFSELALQAKVTRLSSESLQTVPLIPDQWQNLCCPGFTETPLFLQEGVSPSLRASLEAFRVPLVTAEAELQNAIHIFMQTYPGDHLWSVTGPDLVDTLNEIEAEKLPAFLPATYYPLLDYLADPRWMTGPRSYTQDHQKKLRALRIYPTTSGQATSLTDSVFMPGDYEAPNISADVTMLSVTTPWRSLYKYLGVTTLGRAVLIDEILLPRYCSLARDQQVATLEWIRDNVDQAIREIDSTDGDSDTFTQRLSVAPLIICMDGKIRPANRVYDPNVQIVRDVLSHSAAVPDMNLYCAGSQHWLRFFDRLDILKSPHPRDLLLHVKQLVNSATSDGIGSVRSRLRRVFDHLVDYPSLLEDVTDDDNRTLGTALAELAWLPSEQNQSELARYAGYSVPDDRLYLASELQLARNAHLIISQCPIIRVQELEGRVREQFGFPNVPDVRQVLAHFDCLISLQKSEQPRGTALDRLKRSLDEVYRFLAGFRIRDTDELVKADEGSDGAWIRDFYQSRECLWYADRFWRPDHSFQHRVPFFGKRRASLPRLKSWIQDAYELLGMKKEPVGNDFIEYLIELANEFAGVKLPEDEIARVLEVYRLLGREPVDQLGDPSRIPVLTRDCIFQSTGRVYFADAPWFEDRLNPNSIHLAHPDLPQDIVDLLKIDSLAQSLREVPIGDFELAVDTSLHEDCEIWEQTVRSMEFRAGVIRLLRHEGKTYRDGSLDWLGRVNVTPVLEIRTNLFLNSDAGEVRVGGGGSSNYYYAPEKYTVYLNQDGAELLVDDLARAINSQIDEGGLHDLLPLARILGCGPDRIESTLRRLRIKASASDHADVGTEEFQAELTEDELDPFATSGEYNEEAMADTELRSEPTTQLTEPNANDATEQTPVDEAARRDGVTTGGVDSDKGNTDTEETAGNSGSGRQVASNTKQQAPNQRSQPGRPEEISHTSPSGGNSGRGDGTEPGTGSGAHRPHHGEPASRPTQPIAPPGKNRNLVPVYVANDDADNADDNDEHNAERRQELARLRRELGKAAVQIVAADPEWTGWTIHLPESETNEGFDLEATRDGETKYVEVKGTFSDWDDRGVALSEPQFRFASLNRQSTWLYVVEHLKDGRPPVIHRIHDPVSQITQFRFIGSWRKLATSPVSETTLISAVELQSPVLPDSRIRVEGGDEGKVVAVTRRGLMWSLEVEFSDGSTRIIAWNASRITILGHNDQGGAHGSHAS